MKSRILFFQFIPGFIFLFFLNSSILTAQIQCDNDSTGLIPLVDLKTGYYMGLYQGGLYPGGSNVIPAAHKSAGMSVSKGIKPLNSSGNVDWVNGKVVFVAFGASTTGEPFNHFIDNVHAATGINPCLKVANATYGGKGLDIMMDTITNAFYWDYIMGKLANSNVDPREVQVAWFKSGSKVDTIIEMPTMANGIADKYTACLKVIQKKFPNIKMVFMSGFVYGGYGDPTKEFYDVVSEPGGYYNNFAAKWVVQRQIEGDPNLKFTSPGKVSPFIAWGPNEWADGINPNEYDGLFWDCEADFSPDGGGYHLTNAGREKEAELLMNFFSTNPLARRWFLDGPKWNSCDPFGRLASGQMFNTDETDTYTVQDINIYPSPGKGNFYVRFAKSYTGYVDVNVVNTMGEIIYKTSVNTFTKNSGITIDITDKPAGIYFVNVNMNGLLLSKDVEIVK